MQGAFLWEHQWTSDQEAHLGVLVTDGKDGWEPWADQENGEDLQSGAVGTSEEDCLL